MAPEFDGRKRPFTFPPLFGVSESKRNRILSSPEHFSNLEQETVSTLTGKKIEEFFEAPPCNHLDDLLWTGPHDLANDIFPDSSPPPYIVCILFLSNVILILLYTKEVFTEVSNI